MHWFDIFTQAGSSTVVRVWGKLVFRLISTFLTLYWPSPEPVSMTTRVSVSSAKVRRVLNNVSSIGTVQPLSLWGLFIVTRVTLFLLSVRISLKPGPPDDNLCWLCRIEILTVLTVGNRLLLIFIAQIQVLTGRVIRAEQNTTVLTATGLYLHNVTEYTL